MKNRKDGIDEVVMDMKKVHLEESDPLNSEEDVSSASTPSQGSEEKEKWGRKIEFLLSVSGYCVGPGNLWRFPYICMRNGGGAFLIPFVILLFILGLPLFFIEVSLGQFSGRGVYDVWNICPIFKGMGLGMGMASTIFSLYFTIVLAWCTYYIAMSFVSPLPWSLCDREWNTKDCKTERNSVRKFLNISHNVSDSIVVVPLNGTGYATITGSGNATLTESGNITEIRNKVITSEEEFWQYNVLNISGGIDEFGRIQWHLVLCFLASWIIVYLCLARGVKSVGKVVYVTATLPYILLVILLIRGVTLPGAIDGILFYITPDFERILSAQVWMEAAIQIFYSSGIVWGALVTYSSFNKFHNNCWRDSLMLICMGEGTSIFGGFVIFSILGYMAHEVKVPVAEVVKSGPGLGFIAYPEALMELPLPNLWGVLFFLMLYTLALDAVFATLEPMCTALVEMYPVLRRRRVLFMAVVVAGMILLGLPLCTQSGMYIYQLVDWYCASFAIPLFGVFECIVVGWIYGAGRFSRDVELMIGRGIPVFVRVCLCFITPTIMLIILVFIVAKYSLPAYGTYEYPLPAVIFGWFVALAPLIPVPIVAVMEVRKAEGTTFLQKLKRSFQPNSKWKPMNEKVASEYSIQSQHHMLHNSFSRKLKENVFG